MPSPTSRAFMPTLIASCMVMGLGQATLLTFQPLLIAATGLNLAQVNSAFAIGSALFLIGVPMWAALGDYIGRRRVQLIALTGFMMSHVALLILTIHAPDSGLSVDETWSWLTASRIVYGLTACGLVSSSQAWVGAALPHEQRLGSISRLQGGLSAGRLLGPVLASVTLAINPLGPLWLVSLIACPVIVAMINLNELAPHPHAHLQRLPRCELWKRAWRFWPLAFSAHCALGLVQFTAGMWLAVSFGWSPIRAAATMGGILTAAGLAALVVQMGVLPRYSPTKKIVVSSGVMFAFAILLMPLTLHPITPWIGFVGMSLALAVIIPTYTHQAMALVSATQQGQVTGSIAAANTLGYTVAAVLSGWLFEYGANWPLWLAVGFALAATIQLSWLRIHD